MGVADYHIKITFNEIYFTSTDGDAKIDILRLISTPRSPKDGKRQMQLILLMIGLSRIQILI